MFVLPLFLCTYVVIVCNKNMLKRNIFVIYPHTKLSNTYICCRWWGRLLLLPLLIKNIHQTSLLLLQNSYYCCDCYYTADTAIVTTATATSNSWDFVIWYYRAAKRWWDEYGCVLPLSYNCMRGGGVVVLRQVNTEKRTPKKHLLRFQTYIYICIFKPLLLTCFIVYVSFCS